MILEYKKYNLVVEKRISQIVSSIEVSYSFDVITTKHAMQRSRDNRDYLEGYDDRPVSNEEISNLILKFKRIIAEKIFYDEIFDNEPFVIKSKKLSLSVAIIPEYQSGAWWKLVIKTIFRESDGMSLKVGMDQVVLNDSHIK